MKTVALTLMLALHVTGLWPHLSEHTRARIVSRAEQTAPATAPTASLPPATTTGALPVPTDNKPLTVGASSAIAVDLSTATVLYAKDPGVRRPMASITKLITTLTVLSRHSPGDTVTIPELPVYPQEAETMGLVKGDTFKLADLIEAALVPSANDAADAIAIWDAGSTAKFTSRMNTKMAEWGITDTTFVTSSGLEEAGQATSATSLAKIAALALHNPTITRTVGYQSIAITSGQNRTYTLSTTNQLLASGKFYGIKTGYTVAAGECFVGLTRINGHPVITVVLGSDDRFGDTTKIANWIERNWQWL